MNKISEWILDQLREKGWSQSELARRASLDSGNLSRILSGTRQAGPEACNAIALAFGESPEKVFRLAGLLPSLPGPEKDVKFKELLEVVRHLSQEERQEVLEYAFWRYQRQQKRKAKQRNEGANASAQARA